MTPQETINETRPNREYLIEWVQKNIGILPPHITMVMTYSKHINEQQTHILRNMYEYGSNYLKSINF